MLNIAVWLKRRGGQSALTPVSQIMGAECSVVAVDKLSGTEETATKYNSSMASMVPEDPETPSDHVILPRTNATPTPFGGGSDPFAISTTSASAKASSMEEVEEVENQQGEENVSSSQTTSTISTRLSEMSLQVDPAQVTLKKELCTTCKSTVSIAHWRSQFVAAKQLKMESADGNEEDRQMKMKDLMNEIPILIEVSHPSVVKLIGANVDLASPILLTELLEKQDVETLVRSVCGVHLSNLFPCFHSFVPCNRSSMTHCRSFYSNTCSQLQYV